MKGQGGLHLSIIATVKIQGRFAREYLDVFSLRYLKRVEFFLSNLKLDNFVQTRMGQVCAKIVDSSKM